MTQQEVDALFAYKHLPAHLQEISLIFFNAALDITGTLSDSTERTLCLRKLWEAKNLAVWCAAGRT